MGKESITLSMELAKTQSHEFECFEDNYSLTISMQGCRINMCFPGRDTYFQGLGTYSYFEKGCRKNCTRQSPKALWVVLSSLFFK